MRFICADMNIKNIIKNFLNTYSIQYVRLLYMYGKIRYKINIIKNSDIHDIIPDRKSGVCHILGSGWSLNESVSIIDKMDFVIGFNFSGIAYPSPDLHLMEISSLGKKTRKVALAQYDLYRYMASNSKKTRFIYKNIWGINNLRSFDVFKLYGSDVDYLEESLYLISSREQVNKFINLAFNSHKLYQTVSTTIISIAIAQKAGFKKIVLHGIDFEGGHFYDRISVEDGVLLNIISRIRNSGQNPGVHKTNSGYVKHDDLLLIIRRYLKNNFDVELMAALPDTPLGRLFNSVD